MKFPISHDEVRISPVTTGEKNSPCGFTLIEIMVAIAVFTMVVGAIYSSWILLIRATRAAQDVAAQAQRQRVALRTIEDALMAVQAFQASPQYYSFVVENGEAPLLSFTAKVPDVFPRNGKFDDAATGRKFNLRRLTFSVDPGKDGEKDLVLRQNPILMDLDNDEQQYPLVLARNVRKFTVTCWDPQKQDWVDDWENTNMIPQVMVVGLDLGGNTAGGSSAPDFTVTRLLALPGTMMPAAAQNGSAAGGPGGNPANGLLNGLKNSLGKKH
jgi:prepilin-type N-terminal cleavage/methylation domain-containing protein